MVLDAYTVTNTDPIPCTEMTDTDISTWYWCIPNLHAHHCNLLYILGVLNVEMAG